MPVSMSELYPVISAVVGGSGIVSLLYARKERRAIAKTQEATATEIMQRVYARFVTDTEAELGQLREEVKMLRKIVESYKQKCDSCPSNTKNRNS